MTARIRIPLLKVAMPDEAVAAATEAMASGYIAQGQVVTRFEAGLATFLGHEDPIATADSAGTIALALRMAGVAPGDEVVTSPLACLATVTPIAAVGARPAWCDVDPATGMPGPEHLVAAITARSRAILFYHWNGEVGDIGGAVAVGNRHRLPVIEDATEALGAENGGQRLGRDGTFATVYSFQAVRHLTTIEGAALLMADAAQRRRARRLRRYGIDLATFRTPEGEINPASDIPEAGVYLPMNNVSAAVGLAGLKGIETRLAAYLANGRFFDEALAGTPGLRAPEYRPDTRPAYWTYSLRADRRDDLARKLRAAGIGCQVLHLRADTYSCFGGHLADLPGVAVFAAETLSLPCGWWLSEEDRDFIVRCVRSGW